MRIAPHRLLLQEVFRKITGRILELLQSNIIPWRQPWRDSTPYNYVTRKHYTGLNALFLSLTPFSSPAWVTRRQIEKLGAQIRPEHEKNSWAVIFYLPYYIRWVETEFGRLPRHSRLVLCYEVWNIEQTTIPTPPRPVIVPNESLATAQRIVDQMPKRPEIIHNLFGACYIPHCDQVCLPPPAAFEKPDEYYSTLFHELVHATGHVSRLKRPSLLTHTGFGSYTYSQEELVAELGAAYLCACAGIEQTTIENSAAYIRSWYAVLHNAPRFFPKAALDAQLACRFVLGQLPKTQPDDLDAATTSTPLLQLVPATNAGVARAAA